MSSHPLKCEISTSKRCRCACGRAQHGVQTKLTAEELRGEKPVSLSRSMVRVRHVMRGALNRIRKL